MLVLVISVFTLSVVSSVYGSSLSATKTGVNAGSLAKELADLGVYGSRRAIFVRNRADDWIRVWCASKDDATGEQRLNPGESMSFAFKPMIIGGYTVFWCTTDYKTFWARWDAFGNGDYFSGHDNDPAYEYEVRNDGVYYTGKKIRSLASGQNRYTLWEDYDSNKNPQGNSINGFVDNGICNNLPGWMEAKVSAATLCDGHCITLYSELHCKGNTSKLKSGGGCVNFWLSFFNDKPRSVGGC